MSPIPGGEGGEAAGKKTSLTLERLPKGSPVWVGLSGEEPQAQPSQTRCLGDKPQ